MIEIDGDFLRNAIRYIQNGLDNPNNNAHKTLANIWLETLRDYLPERIEAYQKEQERGG